VSCFFGTGAGKRTSIKNIYFFRRNLQYLCNKTRLFPFYIDIGVFRRRIALRARNPRSESAEAISELRICCPLPHGNLARRGQGDPAQMKGPIGPEVISMARVHHKEIPVYPEDEMAKAVCTICGECLGEYSYRGRAVCAKCIQMIRTLY
jgi:hypothetical protein